MIDLAAMATRAHDGDVPLVMLTDEELEAVSPACSADERVVPLAPGWFGDLTGRPRAAVLKAALRSLAARGYVAPPAGVDLEDRLQAVAVRGELAAVLHLRDRARTIVRVDRVRDGRSTMRFAFEVAVDLMLSEAISHAGFHRFVLRHTAREAADMRRFLDPEGWAVDDGPAFRHGDSRPGVWEEVEAAVAAAEVTSRVYVARRSARDRIDELQMTVAAGPAGVWALSGYALTGEDEGGTMTRLTARQVSHPTLQSLLLAGFSLDSALAGTGR